MSGATPLYGWPYPTGPDRLDDAVTTIPQAMATAMENTIAALYAGAIPGAGWVAFPYAANWANPGAPFQTGRYQKTGSRVRVEMYPARSVSASGANSVIGQLPLGYRPLNTTPALVTATNLGGALTINVVTINNLGQVIVANSVPVGAAVPVAMDFSVN